MSGERLRVTAETVDELNRAARRVLRARRDGTVSLLLDELDALEETVGRYERMLDTPLTRDEEDDQ